MKVALITYALNLGGMETFLFRLARQFVPPKHSVDIILIEDRGSWVDHFMAHGISVKPLFGSALRSRTHHARQIARSLQEYDVVFLNDAPFAQSVLGLLRPDTVAISIIHADMHSMYRNAIGSAGEWERVVCVGPRLASRLQAEYGITADKVRMIPYGVQVNEQWPRTEADFDSDHPLRVVYAGRLEDRQKGVLRLPDILSGARKLVPSIELQIIGDGPDSARLRQAMAEAGLNGCVRFSGRLTPEQTREALLEQNVLLLPSNFEGLPVIVLEALASGVVPVASLMPGITDFQIESGRTGFLVNPEDIEGYAQALTSLAMDRGLLRQMSEAGWREARLRFSVETMCQAYVELIEECRARIRQRAQPVRSGRMDYSLLGDLPGCPTCMVRPLRKVLRSFGLWSQFSTASEM
ncbi:MAG: glycosyltransferase family 4 protein [Acidobacteriota bacterium]|jgi:glycosyltransferase involved in cell wall biosynthesis